VLRQLTSHLLLVHTNLRYGMAACPRPGCSAIHSLIRLLVEKQRNEKYALRISLKLLRVGDHHPSDKSRKLRLLFKRPVADTEFVMTGVGSLFSSSYLLI
jgi:hypothetical protein